jgi:hypothetical protein
MEDLDPIEEKQTMSLNAQGFIVINLPPGYGELRESFDDLPLDQHCGGEQRYRRFSQYCIEFREDRRHLSLLPHRSYTQLRKYNNFAGSILRQYKPLKIDPSIHVDA